MDDLVTNGGPFPKLRSIALHHLPSLQFNVDTVLNLRRVNLPWAQMTNFLAGGNFCCPVDFCLDILRHCPDLVTCAFGRIAVAADAVTSHTPVTHNHLRHFQSLSHTSERISAFFELITLPALREVDIGTNLRTIGVDPLTLLVQRSACHLERLSFCHISFEPSAANFFVQRLKALPSLSELSVSTSDRSVLEGIYSALTPDQNGHCPCPHLRTVEVFDKSNAEAQTLFFSPFVLSRWDADPVSSRLAQLGLARLESLRVTLDRPNAHMLSTLRAMRDQGLGVSIVNPEGVSWIPELIDGAQSDVAL